MTYELLVTVTKQLSVTVEADSFEEAKNAAVLECVDWGEIINETVEDVAEYTQEELDRDTDEAA